MKRRDLLKGIAALPVGAAAPGLSAEVLAQPDTSEEDWTWHSHLLGIDIALPGSIRAVQIQAGDLNDLRPLGPFGTHLGDPRCPLIHQGGAA